MIPGACRTLGSPEIFPWSTGGSSRYPLFHPTSRIDGDRQIEPSVVRVVADLEVVAVRRRRVIALELRDVNLGAVRRVDGPRQAAFHQLVLHLVGVPRRNAERDVVDAPAGARVALAEVGVERIAAADDDVADVADHELVLASLVVGRAPAEQ